MHIITYSIAIWIITLFTLQTTNAQPVLTTHSDSTTYSLAHYMTMVKDENRSFTIDQVSSAAFADKFQASPHNNYSLGFSRAGYWLRFTIKTKPGPDYILSICNPLLTNATLYTPVDSAGRKFDLQKAGTDVPQSEWAISYRNPAFRIPAMTGNARTYYLHVWGDNPLDIPIFIESEKNFQKKDHIEQFWQGIFYGILFVMTIYNFILYIFLKDLSYLFYVLYLIFNALFMLSISGYGNQWLWYSPSWWADRAAYIAGNLTACMIVIFSMQFLQLKSTLPFWYQVGRIFIIVCLGQMFLCLFVLGTSLSILLLTIIATVFVIIILSTSIKSYRAGNLSAGYLLLAWTVTLGGISISVLNAFGLIPSNTFTLKGLQIGTVTDVILISLALVDRINSIKVQKLQIEQEKDDAERNQKVKEEVLATMSHEIRTPLNAVIGFAKLLEKTKVTKTQSDYIRHIHDSGENLLVLINDILDLSKINAGKVIFEQVEIDLNESARHLFETLQFQVKEKKLELKLEIQPNVPTRFLGDPVRLNQILLNLLSNAVKFTHTGAVTLRIYLLQVEKQQIALLFEVEDSGIGIPTDRLSSIFEGFTQASNQTTRMYGGTGLGLAIVKQLVEMQGGRVMVNSKVDKGSIFSVILPFYRIFEAQEESEKTSIHPTIPLYILIIDDNPLNQLIAKSTIQNAKAQAKADIASSGQEGIKLLTTTQYDAVLIDLQMPDMDGYEVARHIRMHLTDRQHIPLLAMTASLDEQDHQRAIEAGMNDIVTKPFEAGELFKKIFKLRPDLQNPGIGSNKS